MSTVAPLFQNSKQRSPENKGKLSAMNSGKVKKGGSVPLRHNSTEGKFCERGKPVWYREEGWTNIGSKLSRGSIKKKIIVLGRHGSAHL